VASHFFALRGDKSLFRAPRITVWADCKYHALLNPLRASHVDLVHYKSSQSEGGKHDNQKHGHSCMFLRFLRSPEASV